jgi:hypothetical protein
MTGIPAEVPEPRMMKRRSVIAAAVMGEEYMERVGGNWGDDERVRG